jgi:hypothetical protein
VTTFTRAKQSRTTNNVIALLGSAMMVFPVYWMFATALKQPGQILSAVPKVIPWPISVENFQRALSQPQFWVFARNSITVALSAVILSLLIALGASIAVARFNFIGRKAFLVVLVLIQMIPGSAMVIPIYLMLRSVNALDFNPGLVLTYMTFVLPFTIWTLRGFVEGVPVELEEAALVDGCSRVKAHPRPAAVADAEDRRHIDLRVHIRLGRLPVRLRDHEILCLGLQRRRRRGGERARPRRAGRDAARGTAAPGQQADRATRHPSQARHPRARRLGGREAGRRRGRRTR